MGTCNSKPAIKKNSKNKKQISINLDIDTMDQNKTRKGSPNKKDRASISGFKMSNFIEISKENIKKHYTLNSEIIHSGKKTKIKLATHKLTKVNYAIKIVSKENLSELSEKKLIREINTLKKMDHGNIIRIHDIYESQTNYYIVRDYIAGTNLSKKLANDRNEFNEDYIKKIMKSILSALSYIHRHDIIHGNVQSSNIICSNNKFKSIVLVGFQNVKKENDKPSDIKSRENIQYTAPEVLDNILIDKNDIWSVGIVLYEMLTGSAAFKGTEDEILNKIKVGQFEVSLDSITGVSREAVEIVKKLLTLSYNDRPSADEILQDEWFKTSDTSAQARIILGKYLKNIKNIEFKTKVHESFYLYFIAYVTPQDERFAIYSKLETIDPGHNGVITLDELKTIVNKLNLEYSEEEIEKIFAKADKNNEGLISYLEFAFGMVDYEKLFDVNNIIFMFNVLDKNNNGLIKIEDFKRFVNENDITIDENLNDAWKAIDITGSNNINFNEFRVFITDLSNDLDRVLEK